MFVLVSFGTMDPSPDTCSNLLVVVLFWMISGQATQMLQTVIILYRFEQSRVAQTLEIEVSVSLIISGAFRNSLQSESAQTCSKIPI